MKRQQLILFPLLLVLIFVSNAASYADTLPEGHILHPRSRKAIQLTGIEELASSNQVRRAIQDCVSPHLLCQLIASFRNSSQLHTINNAFSRTEAQLLFLGERHINEEIQYSLANHLFVLKDNQFDSIALEMFNHSDQKYLDQFSRGELTLSEIENVLKKNWSYSPAGYLAILQQARELEMKLIALDNRKETSQLSFSDNLVERDQFMAQVLLNHLQSDPNQKIIVYSGRLHSFQSFDASEAQTISEVLKETLPNLKTESLLFFSYRERSALSELRKFLKPEQSLVFKAPEFHPFFDGAILLADPEF